MRTIFITGSNRGIGLGLAQSYLQAGNKVIAAARNPEGARDLWELERDYGNRLQVVTCDVSDEKSIESLKGQLNGVQAIDVLINNAGVYLDGNKGLSELTSEIVQKSFQVNVTGPLLVTRVLLPLLQKAKQPVVGNVSSMMGSITDNKSGGSYAYRMSKTALNMFTKCLAQEDKRLIAVTLHPGWVQTQMGGPNALITVEESVSGLFKLLESLKPQDSGKFYDFRGQEKPW